MAFPFETVKAFLKIEIFLKKSKIVVDIGYGRLYTSVSTRDN